MRFVELTRVNDLNDACGPVHVAIDRISCLVPLPCGEHVGCMVYIGSSHVNCYESAVEVMAKIEAAKA